MADEIEFFLERDKSIQQRYWKGKYKEYEFDIEDESNGVFTTTLFVEYEITCTTSDDIILSAQLSETIEETSFCWIDEDGESHDLLQDKYEKFDDLPLDFQTVIKSIESQLEKFEVHIDNFDS